MISLFPFPDFIFLELHFLSLPFSSYLVLTFQIQLIRNKIYFRAWHLCLYIDIVMAYELLHIIVFERIEVIS